MFLLALLTAFSAHAIELEFRGSVHWLPILGQEPRVVGGFSALAQLPDGRYLALSDERQFPRAYILNISLAPTDESLQITLGEETLLRDGNGIPFAPGALDPESLAVLPDGSWLVGSEGDMRPTPRVAPLVMHMSAQGQWLENLPLPEKFLPDAAKTQTKGVTNNEAFESLTYDIGSQRLFTMNEGPLLQDGKRPSFESGALLRVVDWRASPEGKFTLAGEHAYPLSPIPKLIEGEGVQGIIGASEALALNADTLLVLERSYVFKDALQGIMHARLYETKLSSGEDISARGSLSEEPLDLLEKKLVLDFTQILPQLPAVPLDNLEGMVWGPRLKDGRRTLVFVSDSNFNPFQETQFLLFVVNE